MVSHAETLTAEITKEERQEVARVLGKEMVADKTVLAMRMVSHGIPLEDISRLALGHDNPDHKTIKALKRNSQKWLLASEKMQKLAGSAAEKILKGQPIVGKSTIDGKTVENVILPKGSHIVSVIDMVTRRTEPIKQQSGSGGINLFIDKVQVNQFQALDTVSNQAMGHGPVIECNDIRELGDE